MHRMASSTQTKLSGCGFGCMNGSLFAFPQSLEGLACYVQVYGIGKTAEDPCRPPDVPRTQMCSGPGMSASPHLAGSHLDLLMCRGNKRSPT